MARNLLQQANPYAKFTPPNQDERNAMKKGWAESRGLKEAFPGYGKAGLSFLDKKIKATQFPAHDHVTYWRKEGKPFCVVSQPYGVSHNDLAEIALVAKGYGLSVQISSYPSWHYPHGVLSIIWEKK